MATNSPNEGRGGTPSSLQEALARKSGRPAETLRRDGEALGSAPGEAAPRTRRGLPSFSFGPGPLDRAVFCRQLATLIQVGIPVLKALQLLSVRTPNLRLRRAVADAALGVEEGQPIHAAMARHERTFSPLVVSIVRVGETGGILESSLQRLADIMEGKARIRRRIWSASMYPAVALFVAVLVVTIIMVQAIPVFAEVYNQQGAELPDSTQIVIGMSNFFVAFWPLVFLLIAAIVVGLVWWGRTRSGHRAYSWGALHMPVTRGISRKLAVARSCRTLGELLVAGIPLTEAIAITADSSENAIVADAWRRVLVHVERGERMSDPLARAGVFPPLVVDMIAVGEETGTLDVMLLKVADTYDTEVDASLNGISSIIEPVLIIILGGVVLFIAFAVLMPYFNLANVVGVG